jgi:hypothetical protein
MLPIKAVFLPREYNGWGKGKNKKIRTSGDRPQLVYG